MVYCHLPIFIKLVEIQIVLEQTVMIDKRAGSVVMAEMLSI